MLNAISSVSPAIVGTLGGLVNNIGSAVGNLTQLAGNLTNAIVSPLIDVASGVGLLGQVALQSLTDAIANIGAGLNQAAAALATNTNQTVANAAASLKDALNKILQAANQSALITPQILAGLGLNVSTNASVNVQNLQYLFGNISAFLSTLANNNTIAPLITALPNNTLNQINAFLGNATNFVANSIALVKSTVGKIVSGGFNPFSFLENIVLPIKTVTDMVNNIINGTLNSVNILINGLAGGLVNTITNINSLVNSTLNGVVGNALNIGAGLLSNAAKILDATAKAAITTISGTLTSVGNKLKNIFNNLNANATAINNNASACINASMNNASSVVNPQIKNLTDWINNEMNTTNGSACADGYMLTAQNIAADFGNGTKKCADDAKAQLALSGGILASFALNANYSLGNVTDLINKCLIPAGINGIFGLFSISNVASTVVTCLQKVNNNAVQLANVITSLGVSANANVAVNAQTACDNAKKCIE